MFTACIFCKIIKGAIPCHKLFETSSVLCFLDINPLSHGHFLVIPKEHGENLTDISDESLSELLVAAKKVILALGPKNYNLLQNNGRIAHQEVDHVHFHIIPKTASAGLEMKWDSKKPSNETLEQLKADIMSKI